MSDIRPLVGMMCLPILSCAPSEQARLDAALETITAEDLGRHVEVLASDEFGGRLPATEGEAKTTQYLAAQFEALGLQPANDGSWFQEVPLVSITADPSMALSFRYRGRVRQYAYGEGFMAWTKRVVPAVELEDSEMVFVGYGIVAPEYEWDDYAGLDVAGKTVVILVNDPGYATGDAELFKGNAMTYYGRWTYKYEEAARQGAAAALIVHETGPAGYGWNVVSGSWAGPQFDLVAADDNLSRVKVEGWLQVDAARELFNMGGLDYDQLKAAAAGRDFVPATLPVRASISIRNEIERSSSDNVLALLSGTDRADQYVLYMAHWDHLGRDSGLEGDQIYNGAFDNASGTAALLEIAQAYASLDPAPSRSVVFFATTAEEQGLLGSAHYAENPVFPLPETVAAINMDGINTYGRMTDIVVIGYGNSELDDILAAAAQTQNRTLVPDPEPEKGYFYRSDHFPLSKKGVPALYTDVGTDHIEHGTEWVTARKNDYRDNRYHQPSDEYSAAWDLAGGVDDVRLFFRVGYDLTSAAAVTNEFPNWNEGTEFKAARDRMMADGESIE
ncbi:MAG: M28 family metallopeptidase [Gemmatimonadota bacterium]